MIPDEIDALLSPTLDDRRLSRGERQALGARLDDLGPDLDREAFRRRAFALARESLAGPKDREVVDWLEEVVRLLQVGPGPSVATTAEAHFSPGDDCPTAIIRLLGRAQATADVCVFTITDDRLADALIDAHRRGVRLRIISDDAKAEDLGSDVGRFERAGIAVRVDRSPFHMHHKFAVVDARTLLTGSYNWTRGAARDNEENLVILDDPRLVGPFGSTFERLWASLA